jgi:hypothetical protein
MKTFEANGKKWSTDEQTLALLNEFKQSNNEEMLGMTFELGKKFGRITEVK